MKILTFFILFYLFLSCSTHKESGLSLEQGLSMAGENRKELEKVLEYYKKDSFKLKAAQYLIVNMPFHFSRVEYFQSPDGKRYVPDVTAFPDNQAVKKNCDSLQAKGYFIQKDLVYDSKTLTSDYLIRNIDLAFKIWQKPWVRDLAFEDFCRYVLPYRSQTEPISDLRKELMERYLPLLDTTLVKNAFEACMIVNAQFMVDLKYKKTGNPLYPTIEETYYAKMGECDALCNFATYVMRAVGIPVVVQNTIWTNMDLGHSWNAVLQEGHFYDFSPAYVQPDIYKYKLATTSYLKPAKIYRYLFEPEYKEKRVHDDGYITYLKNPLLRDVTAEGESRTFHLRIATDKIVSKTEKPVYLCAYNNNQWEPLAIGVLKDSICEFENVAGNNIFIVAEAIDEQSLQYICAPFLAKTDGSTHKFIPNIQKMKQIELLREENKPPAKLYYWDTMSNLFKYINCDSINDKKQFYTKIPENSLLCPKIVQKSTRLVFLQNDTLKRTCDL